MSAPGPMVPGEIVHGDGPVPLNPGRERVTLRVVNTADRPIQVGSHYHFAAANPGLAFDRDAAWGRRLDVPAGTALRFEPGVERDVALVPIGGRRVVPGLRPEWAGPLDGRGPAADRRGAAEGGPDDGGRA
ncbi:urease subunit beta [Sphaerisporangium fuscum]|uniref:urease subunit beta n=1 Tax=Sphaerisporangium fuscum TaxID=2835868 RepID=UPI002029A5AA|nr:urease subunit beta [Sphaerisporangium fuscum]